jgi:hypothetical protein
MPSKYPICTENMDISTGIVKIRTVEAFLLLPFNRPRRLAGHIINHAVNAFDLIDNTGGGAGEETH